MPFDFESGSSHRFASTATGWGAVQAVTFAVLCTVESLPGAATYRFPIALSSGTTARQMGICLNGDNSGSLAFQTGVTRANPGATIVPPLDTWVILAATKASGTVAPVYYMFRFDTLAWTRDAAGGTIANRTAAVVTGNIGGLGAASFWDGYVEIAAMWPHVMTDEQIYDLARGPGAWYQQRPETQGSTTVANSILVDCRHTLLAPVEYYGTQRWTGGTNPGFAGLPSATVPRSPWA